MMLIITSILTSLALAGTVVARNDTDMFNSDSSGPWPITSPFRDQPSGQPITMSRIVGENSLLPPNVIPSEDNTYFTTCLPVYGNIKASHCDIVLDMIARAPVSAIGGIMRITPGTCKIWWASECMAKVCAMEEQTYDRPLYVQPGVVVDRIRRDAMDLCVTKGKSAVVADYWRYTDEARLWRYFLQKKH